MPAPDSWSDTRRVRPFAIALLASLIAGSTITGAPASAARAKKPVTLTFSTTLSSSVATLESLPGGHTYGWNNLNGPTTWGNQDATITFLGDVDYMNGSVPLQRLCDDHGDCGSLTPWPKHISTASER